jgi:serine/threonine protein kinase
MAHATNANVTAHRACEGTQPVRRRRGRPDDALAVGSRVSSWRVESELGRGGMASVHSVVHAKFGKRAAIKIAHKSVIGDHLSTDTFLREARIVHMVDHPAVIDVFATGSCDGRPYLVMEKLTGKTLGQIVDDGPAIDRRDAVGYLLELCDVLRAAHQAGIVHRDVKLDNVLVCDTPFADGRRVKLLDWGVARIDGEDDPFRGLIAGTLTYVAPEQIRGDALTPAADVYSLAVLAYHLLCRRAPFEAGNDLALIHLHLRAEPPRPSIAWTEIPEAIEDLLLRMLAKQPEARPSLDDVERVLRACIDEVDPASARFAEGSKVDIALPRAQMDSSWMRWLMVKHGGPELFTLPTVGAANDDAPIHDVLGRPILAPPFRISWMVLAAVATGIATLLSALPG